MQKLVSCLIESYYNNACLYLRTPFFHGTGITPMENTHSLSLSMTPTKTHSYSDFAAAMWSSAVLSASHGLCVMLSCQAKKTNKQKENSIIIVLSIIIGPFPSSDMQQKSNLVSVNYRPPWVAQTPVDVVLICLSVHREACVLHNSSRKVSSHSSVLKACSPFLSYFSDGPNW